MKNAIDLDRFAFCKETRRKIRAELGLEDSFVVGHIGRFDRPKNQGFLVKIFAELKKQKPDAVLLLIGDGELREEVHQQAEQMGIGSSVHFLGVRNDVPELLQAMDTFVFPSQSEGLGIVLIEAQTAGLHCFTSKNVVPKEAEVSELLQFISLDESAEEWAKRIMQTDFSEERVSRAKEAASHGYDIKTSAKGIESFYLTSFDTTKRKDE